MRSLLARWRARRAAGRARDQGYRPSPATERWLRAELAAQVGRVPVGDGLAAVTRRTRRQP